MPEVHPEVPPKIKRENNGQVHTPPSPCVHVTKEAFLSMGQFGPNFSTYRILPCTPALPGLWGNGLRHPCRYPWEAFSPGGYN